MPVFTVDSSNEGILTVKWSKELNEICGELIKNNLADDTYETIPLVKAPGVSGDRLFSAETCDLMVIIGQVYSIRLITYREDSVAVVGSNGYSNVKRQILRATEEIICYGETKPPVVNFSLSSANQAIIINLPDYSSTEKSVYNGFNIITGFEVLIKNVLDNDEELISYSASDVVNKKIVVKTMQLLSGTRSPNPLGVGLINKSLYKISIRALNDKGAGLFSAKKQIAPDSTIPNSSSFTGAVSSQNVTLTWSRPSLGGEFNANETNYYLYKKLQSANTWDSAVVVPYYIPAVVGMPAGYGPTTHVFSGLQNGSSYMFKLVVVSGIYYSEPVETGPLVPYTKPDTLTDSNEDMTMMEDGSIRFVLRPPSSNGGKNITAYKCVIQGRLNQVDYAAGAALAGDKSCSFTVPASDLTVGLSHMFQLYSFNGKYSDAYSKEYNAYKKPEAPINLRVLNYDSWGNVQLYWDEPATLSARGGVNSNVLHYTILYKAWAPNYQGVMTQDTADTEVQVGTSGSYRFDGLQKGYLYTFRVRAFIPSNLASSLVESWEAGKFVSGESAPKTCISAIKPTAPGNVTVQRAADKLNTRISWSLPSLGGLALSKYQYQINSGVFRDISTYSTDADSGKYYIELDLEAAPNSVTLGTPFNVIMKTLTLLPASDDGNRPNSGLLESASYSPVTHTSYKAPAQITGLELFPVHNGIELRWTKPDSWGGYSGANRKIYINNYNTREDVIDGNKERYTVQLDDNSAAAISVVPVGLLNSQENDMGPIVSMVGYPNNEPLPPTGLVAVPGDKQVTLQWVHSASYMGPGAAGSSPPTYSYVIFRDERKLSTVVSAAGEAGSDMEFTDNGPSGGLNNGQEYIYRVVTKQLIGSAITFSDNFEATSDSVCRVYPQKPPANLAPPLTLVPRHQQIDASWAAPSDSVWLENGLALKNYHLELWDKGLYGSTITPTRIQKHDTTATYFQFKGLSNGKEYEVRVYVEGQDKNNNLIYARSVGFITANCVPSVDAVAPANQQASVGDQQITLTWEEPVDANYGTDKYNVFLGGVQQGSVSFAEGVSGTPRTYSKVFSLLNNSQAYSVSVSRVTSATSSQPAVESAKVHVNNKIPVGSPVIMSARRITNENGRQLEIIVKPNGSRITSFVAYAPGSNPSATDVVLHAQASIASSSDPNYFQLGGVDSTVTLVTTQLRLSSDIVSSAYIVCVTEGYKYAMVPVTLA